MLDDIYSNAEKEGRSLIQAALKTSGSIRLDDEKVVIQLSNWRWAFDVE